MKNGFFISLIALIFLSNCSVSSSGGRKDFEALAPLLRQKNEVDALEEKDLEHADTCWSQPSSEPLLFVEPGSYLTVKPVDSREIEVCVTKMRGSHE